jgi:restriction system protein
MLPLLKFASDEKEHSTTEAINHLAALFNLSEEDQNHMLPSGTQKTFTNRVYWAKSYLKMAGLIDSPQRSYFKITPAGKATINKNLSIINIAYLNTIDGFKEKRTPAASDNVETKIADIENDLTPEENIEQSYQNIKSQLAEDILLKIKEMSPKFFENLVVELLVKMGYGGTIKDAGQAVGRSGDEGIDGIIKEDRLGLGKIYIQAKRWDGCVGRPEIQKFLGALVGQGAQKGVFITTSYFSKEALGFDPKGDTKIVLIDGEQLAQYMIDYDLGVSTVATYQIKRIDLDYFGEE